MMHSVRCLRLLTWKRLLLPGLLLSAPPTPAAAQLSGAGFVPSLVPAAVQQAPLLSLGYSRWRGAGGPVARADLWRGRAGAAVSVGTVHGDGADALTAGGTAMLELLPQGVGLRAPGVQIQAGYTTTHPEGKREWAVPLSAGIFLHVPPPLPRRAHGLVQPALSVRHVIAGSARGTSATVSLRLVVSDGGPFTNWGASAGLRVVSDGVDVGPRWEAAVTRVLRRSVPRGG